MVAGCSPLPKTGYDFDRSTNFGGYKTYAWLSQEQEKTGDRRADSSAVDMRIRIAVGTQLRLKGYQTLPEGKPDFFVTYTVGLKDSSPTVSSQYFSEGMAGHPFCIQQIAVRSVMRHPRSARGTPISQAHCSSTSSMAHRRSWCGAELLPERSIRA